MNNSPQVCYLCKRPNLKPFESFSWLVQCRDCSLVFNPHLSINSHEVSAHFYDERNLEHRKRIRKVLEDVALKRWLWLQQRTGLDRGHLLEIGSGTGEFLVAARRIGWKVQGLELSHHFRVAARDWYRLDLQGRELINVGFAPEAFDVVALLHVFEHLSNPLEFLDQIYEILKPGGWLFIVVPNLLSWTDALFGNASPTLTKRDHFFHYTPKTLRETILHSGFYPIELVTSEPSHHLWTSLYSFFSSKRASKPKTSAIEQPPSVPSKFRKIMSNLPYWAGSLTSIPLTPWRLWLQKTNKAHEIYLLCRRPL